MYIEIQWQENDLRVHNLTREGHFGPMYRVTSIFNSTSSYLMKAFKKNRIDDATAVRSLCTIHFFELMRTH